MHDLLLERVLRRNVSMFHRDMEKNYDDLKTVIFNSKILVIGAAGSIGSAFVKQLSHFRPSILHLVDPNENSLVEVVRDLRSSNIEMPIDFKTFSIAMGTDEFTAFLHSQYGYDYYVNFSALKHVRSERDPYTLMRMVYTNVCSTSNLLNIIDNFPAEKFFSVSSDKAVNPVSIMGATKAFMEKLMIAHSDKTPCSSSRFANVAFSDGSLLHGFQNRIDKKQPISAPSDIRRYFISHEEAGSLCLLSCFLGNNRENYFPKLDKCKDMYTFSEIVEIFLDCNGLKPIFFDSEVDAKNEAKRITSSSKEWPCHLSKSDTSGEKLYEEFYTEADSVDLKRYQDIGVISEPRLSRKETELIDKSLITIEGLRKQGVWSKSDIVDCIKMVIATIQHKEKGKSLDEKM